MSIYLNNHPRLDIPGKMPSKLEQMQLQFRQKLMQEKEERMIKIHNDNQQKALSKVTRYNGSPPVKTTMTISKPPMVINAAPTHHSPVKKGSPGVDRSRPLPPISKEPRKICSTRTSPVSSSVDNGYKGTINNVRSRSVELESRQSPPRLTQNGRTPLKNGYGRPSCETDGKNFSASVERKVEQDLVAKLQRMRTNGKVEETSPRNGYSTQVVQKSSADRKPATTSYRTQVTPRPEPKSKAPPSFKKPVPSTGRSSDSVQGRKPPGPGQEQCAVCHRNFNQDRIEKHRTICSKAAKKKVKVFDATKMRVQGTEAEQYVKKGLPKTPPKSKNSNWRKQHQEFIEAIRQAKMVQQHVAAGGKLSDLPPPPPSDTSHYVPCPHCGRKFNEGVAERHIPKCKNIACNKKAPPQKRK